MAPLFISLLVISASGLEEDAEYQRAVGLYQSLEFEQAVFRFQSVAVQPALTDEERATVFMWLGLCYSGIGNELTAQQFYRDALTSHADVVMPEPNPPPNAVEQFASVRESIRAEAAASAEGSAAAASNEAGPSKEVTSDASSSASSTSDVAGLPPLSWVGVAAAGAGVVALAGGGALVAVAVVLTAQISSLVASGGFASEVNNAVAMRFAALSGAGVFAVVGLALAVAGVGAAAAGIVLE